MLKALKYKYYPNFQTCQKYFVQFTDQPKKIYWPQEIAEKVAKSWN